MTFFATTPCSVVAEDAVTQTGLFRDLIAPTSPLSGGFDESYAKTRWGIYPHSVHTATATHKAVSVSPTYDSGEDKVYTTELVEKTASDLAAERQAIIGPIAAASYESAIRRRADELEKAGDVTGAIILRLVLLGV